MLRCPCVTLWEQCIEHQRAHDSHIWVLFFDTIILQLFHTPRFEAIINAIVSYLILPVFHCLYLLAWFQLDRANVCFVALRKRAWKWVYCKHLNCAFNFMCKVDFMIDNFIFKPTYTYNETMQLLSWPSGSCRTRVWIGFLVFSIALGDEISCLYEPHWLQAKMRKTNPRITKPLDKV